MKSWLALLPLSIAAAGLICFLLSISCLRQARPGIKMMLDLWVAAGLLHLSVSMSWSTLASSAVLILSRKLIVWSLERLPQRVPGTKVSPFPK